MSGRMNRDWIYFDWRKLGLKTGGGVIEGETTLSLSRGVTGLLLVVKVVVGLLVSNWEEKIKAGHILRGGT